MVMVDSNVVIDFWRNPTDDMKREFLTHECCICGVQIAELLYGAVSEKDSAAIESALSSSFTFIQIEDSDWSLLGKFLYRLRRKGIQVPFPDALIASLAIRYDIPVWTRDKHFHLIQSVFPDLKLFEGNMS